MKETEPLYGHEQALFPIVQGSTHLDLRRASAHAIAEVPSLGYAIGGLSVGAHEDMYAMCEEVCAILPEDAPRYMMGVGTPVNILENIALVDMFDCVMPTRNARTGTFYTWDGIMNMKNAKCKRTPVLWIPRGPARWITCTARLRPPPLHANELLALYIDRCTTWRFTSIWSVRPEPKFKPEPSVNGRIAWWFNWLSVCDS